MRQKAISSEIDPNRIPRIFNTKSYLNLSGTIAPQNEIDRAADMILEAKLPVIIAGNGVHLSKSYQELRELAELLGAPVATSYKGQSAIEGIHPLAVGMMGTFGQKVALGVISDADVLLVAGCHMSPSDTRYDNPQFIDPGRQKIIQIDIDPRNSGWNFPVDVSLNGDLNLVLEQILKALRGKVLPAFSASRTREIEDRKQRDGFCEAPELYSDASPILPQRIVKEIENAVDPSTIITLDAGNNRLWVSNLFKSKAPGSLFVPGGVAGMAWGPPAALAAKLVCPDRPVLSISGDGGFAMMFHVLSTAIQYQLPVTFLVMNNSMLGMVNNLQSMKQRIIATVFAETDFAQVAKAFGCNGIKVTDPGVLGETIKKSLHASLPTVIDVATDPNESFFKIAQLEDFLRVM